MLAYDYVLAAALLTQPPGLPEMDLGSDTFAALHLPLQALALEWEVLDPRELRFVLVRAEDFHSDMNLLRRRYHDLADAPRVADAQRFPDRATVAEYLAFNRAYRKHIDTGILPDAPHGWKIRLALQETDHLYQVWEIVRDSCSENYYVTMRRHALKKLRAVLGDEDYYAGRLPPFVPLWRFQEMR
jgi:hypothetical protein